MKKINIILIVLNCIIVPVSAQLTSTNLPILKITTTVPITGSKTQATLAIIDNTSGLNNIVNAPTFNGIIGISNRGGFSGNFPTKPSYNIETWIDASQVSLDTSLLGMPSENDWVLLASYADRSFVRNILPYSLYNNMGNYAPRMKLCEVMLDNNYQGVYLFGEKIKRDTFRVDISKLEPFEIASPEVTGGYILKVTDNAIPDWTSSKPPYNAANGQTTDFFIDYPDVNTMPAEQNYYIKSYVDSFENALFASNFQDTSVGWRNYGGYTSFMDYMIISEVAKNFDAYRNNFYLYKSKNKKLKPGPLWEMDQAFHNTNNCNVSADTGFCYLLANYCSTQSELPVFYFEKLSRDTTFMKDLKCRYKELRSSILSIVKINTIIDSISAKMNVIQAGNSPQGRNFSLYPIFGVNTINEPLPMATNYSSEITALKTFIQLRLDYLDNKWGTSSICFPIATNDIVKNNFKVNLFPNPTSDKLNIVIESTSKQIKTIQIIDLQGRVVLTKTSYKLNQELDIKGINNGIYLVQIKQDGNMITQKITIQK